MATERPTGDEDGKRNDARRSRNSAPPSWPATEEELKALLAAPPGPSIADIIAEIDRESKRTADAGPS